MNTQNKKNTKTSLRHRLCTLVYLTVCLVVVVLLAACQQNVAPAPLLPEGLRIGIVPVKQARTTTDLLAGNIPTIQGMASVKNLQDFDSMLLSTLRTESKRSYTFMRAEAPTSIQNDYRPALRKLLEQGQRAGMDLLIVPIIISWTERQGGEAGVVSSAELTMDIFLVNVQEESILRRTHFSEKQEDLSSNLLKAPSFFKRGGKWVTTLELAQEVALTSIQDFGL